MSDPGSRLARLGLSMPRIDIDLVVDYGVSIPDVSQSVRDNVIQRIERMTGLQVTEVNISVDDVYLGDDTTPEPPRVQ